MTIVEGESITQRRESVDCLRAPLESADGATLRDQSACADWSVARVAAHLGAGAEIALVGLTGGLVGSSEPIASEDMQSIWDAYDALDDLAVLRRAVDADRSLGEAFEQLTDIELADVRSPWQLPPSPSGSLTAAES